MTDARDSKNTCLEVVPLVPWLLGRCRGRAAGAPSSSILTRPRPVIPPPIPQGRSLCSLQSALLPTEAGSGTAALLALFCFRGARIISAVKTQPSFSRRGEHPKSHKEIRGNHDNAGGGFSGPGF